MTAMTTVTVTETTVTETSDSIDTWYSDSHENNDKRRYSSDGNNSDSSDKFLP